MTFKEFYKLVFSSPWRGLLGGHLTFFVIICWALDGVYWHKIGEAFGLDAFYFFRGLIVLWGMYLFCALLVFVYRVGPGWGARE